MSLYHYTNIQSVYSILSHQKLWLTDVRFLNDARELQEGLETITNNLNHIQGTVLMNFNYMDKAIDYVRGAFKGDWQSYDVDEDPLFIFSLSSKKNLLSQWRAYGNYAIEFDIEKLKEKVGNIFECRYEKKKKLLISTEHISNAVERISVDMKNNEGNLGPQSIDALMDLIKEAATYKNEHFREEKESRIIRSSDDSSYPNNVKYRHRDNMLIPFIEIDISLDCIKSIQIGPMKDQDLSYTSLKGFVGNIVKNWQVDSSNVEYELNVEKSDIPYRE